jgi:hypothetical protein
VEVEKIILNTMENFNVLKCFKTACAIKKFFLGIFQKALKNRVQKSPFLKIPFAR